MYKSMPYGIKECICGACEYKIVREGVYNCMGASNYPFAILKCKNCGLMRTFPTPSSSLWSKNTSGINNLEEGTAAPDVWSKALALELQKWCLPGNSILDLGCYTGNLVEELQKLRFKAIGCDINPAAVKKGLGLGRNIRLGTLLDCKFEDSLFEAVICNQALEHILDLSLVIHEIERVLKKNGLLFVFVPYYKGAIPKIMGNNWIGWFPQQHVWHFDKNTLQHIILSHGNFKVESIKSKGMVEPISKGIKGLIKKTIGKSAGFLNFGDEIETVFKKR